MSDATREPFTHKVEAAIKPDSMKSTPEHFSDKARGHVDSAGSTLEPQGEKSYGQKIVDSTTHNQNAHVGNQDQTTHKESILEKVEDALHIGHKHH